MNLSHILRKFDSGMAAAVFLPLIAMGAAARKLGAPFADHAVLQRQAPIPVWGWSKPGTEVPVEFAGQKQSAKAEENGKWTITLTPHFQKAAFI